MSNGIGMDSPPNSQPSGAVTSNEVGRKNSSQGKFKSGIQNKTSLKVDRNKHGIRRETTLGNKKGRPKKV